VDRNATMCEFCGALLAPGGRRHAFRLEGVVCFYCGDQNRWSPDAARCTGCGRSFATTCPRCGEGVPLRNRHCQRCGLSVEDFDTERARVTVARSRGKRDDERVLWMTCRWAAVLGLILMLVAWFLDRRWSDFKRPLAVAGGFTACTAAAAMGAATVAHRHRRRRWPLE
jgi:hypothetical protein